MAAHLLVQISDTHLSSGPPSARTGSAGRLASGLRLLEESGIRPDAFLLTGDLADAGEGPCYEALAKVMDEAAQRTGASVVYVPGNHDRRAAFRQHLLGLAPEDSPINQVRWLGGLRLVAVDSTIPGEAFGELDEATLAFLASALAEPAPEGTVLALHHPPITSPIAPMSALRLRNAADLERVVAGSDVRVVLCGHNHHSAAGLLGAVPVWVSPAVAYQADVTSTEVFRGTPGSAFSRVDLHGKDLTLSIVPLPPDRPIPASGP